MSDDHGHAAKPGAATAHGGGHGGGGHEDEGSHEEHHEGAPEWLISFADNVALMMGFFVILLAMNMSPKGDTHASKGPNDDQQGTPAKDNDVAMAEFVVAVRKAFNNPVDFTSPDPRDLEIVKLLKERGWPDVKDSAPEGDKAQVQSIRPTDYHKLSAAVPFEEGSATLSKAGQETIASAASHLRGLRLVVELRGHVSAAETAAQSDHAMKLSFDRTMAVARVLAAHGIDWKQLRLIACGDNERLRDLAYSPDEQKTNQRVEIILTDELVKDDNAAPEPSTKAGAKPDEKPAGE
jgi:flagellar motor protein MotB